MLCLQLLPSNGQKMLNSGVTLSILLNENSVKHGFIPHAKLSKFPATKKIITHHNDNFLINDHNKNNNEVTRKLPINLLPFTLCLCLFYSTLRNV